VCLPTLASMTHLPCAVLAHSLSRLCVLLALQSLDAMRIQHRELAHEVIPRISRKVVTEILYRVQTNPLIGNLGNGNVATDIGSLMFIQSAHIRAGGIENYIHKDRVVISQHELEFEFLDDQQAAYSQYVRFDGMLGHANKSLDPINSVGIWSGDRGAWMSLPSKLQCGTYDVVGNGCAWKHKRPMRLIYASCLACLKDRETGYLLNDLYEDFHVPRNASNSFTPHFFSGGWDEARVQREFDDKSKVALRLFRRAFQECPNIDKWRYTKDNMGGVLERISWMGVEPPVKPKC